MQTPDDVVARNLAEIRAQRRMSVREVAARLAELGHPILASGVNKIENGQRRVDVGDLVALAVVLGVSPMTLVMPAEPGDVQLTPAVVVEWERAWRWAVGDQPLGHREGLPTGITDYLRVNRPFEGPSVVEIGRQLRARDGVPITARFYYRPDIDHVAGEITAYAPDHYRPSEGTDGERQAA